MDIADKYVLIFFSFSCRTKQKNLKVNSTGLIIQLYSQNLLLNVALRIKDRITPNQVISQNQYTRLAIKLINRP